MFPNYLVIRIALRISLLVLDSIAPFSLAWTIASLYLWPVHPLAAAVPLQYQDYLLKHDFYLHNIVTAWCLIETIWWGFHSVGRQLVARGYWDSTGSRESLGTEERWRLWVKMLESSEDPWDWLKGAFLAPGAKSAPMGIEDPAITKVKIQDVGRTNVEQFMAHFLFGIKLKQIKLDSLERLEMNAMVKLLEIALSQSRGGEFKFLKGRSRHRVFLMNDEPILTSHHPAIFYVAVWIASEFGNLALWLGGFKYYGSKRSYPFPPFFMRGSRKALDALHDPLERAKMEASKDAELADKIGYWFHPGSRKAQEEGLTPILFFHGISGTYGPSPFILFLQYVTGRPFFLPEFPYVTMRLSPPSSIRTRVETVAAVRQMIWRHGFGLTNDASFENNEEEEDEDDWRRGRVVVTGHSMGGGTTGWLLRDAPDIIAGIVLLDPMSIMVFAADSPRNFFRTKVKTAGEIFFKYFASERGIRHFMTRWLRWSDSVIFGPRPVLRLPEEAVNSLVPKIARTPLQVPYDRPNYAQTISPCPEGPIPAQVFLSESDCILNVKGKLAPYLRNTGFEDGKNLFVMPGEHAAVLVSPYWGRRIAQAITEVADAGEKLLYESIENEEEAEKQGDLLKLQNGNAKHEEENDQRKEQEVEELDKVANDEA